MNRYIAHTQSARADGVAKYPKGYEQHMAPEGGFGDTPHIKWYNNGGDGHIFMTPQTNMKNSYTFNKLNKIELSPDKNKEHIHSLILKATLSGEIIETFDSLADLRAHLSSDLYYIAHNLVVRKGKKLYLKGSSIKQH